MHSGTCFQILYSRLSRRGVSGNALDQRHGGGWIAWFEAADHIEEDVAGRFASLLGQGSKVIERASRRPGSGTLGPAIERGLRIAEILRLACAHDAGIDEIS